jgi:hypothetical protein
VAPRSTTEGIDREQAAHLSPAADGLMYEAFVRPMMKLQTDPAVSRDQVVQALVQGAR